MAHATLRPGVNIALILVWGSLAFFMTIMSNPRPLAIVPLGAALGLILGFMQSKGLREAGDSICEARTAMEVRSHLKKASWGRKYIYGLWLSGLVVVAISVSTSAAPLSLIAGYFAFMFVRELVTLRVTFQLGRPTARTA